MHNIILEENSSTALGFSLGKPIALGYVEGKFKGGATGSSNIVQ